MQIELGFAWKQQKVFVGKWQTFSCWKLKKKSAQIVCDDIYKLFNFILWFLGSHEGAIKRNRKGCRKKK
jgi:hypothetical protein